MAKSESASPALAHNRSRLLSQISNGLPIYLLITLAGLIFSAAQLFLARPAVQDPRSTLFPTITALLFYACALWMYFARRKHTGSQVYSTFCASAALVCACTLSIHAAKPLVWFWSIGVAIGSVSLVDLTLFLPRGEGGLSQVPALRVLAYLVGVILALANSFAWVGFGRGASLVTWTLLALGLISVVFTLLHLLLSTLHSVSPVDREIYYLLTLSAFTAFLPLTAAIAYTWLNGARIGLLSITTLLALLFPAAVGYVLYRYHMIDTRFILGRTMLYAALALLITLGFAFILSGLGFLLTQSALSRKPLILGAIFFLLALLLSPIKQLLEKAANALFFRGEQAYQDRLERFSSALTKIVELPGILQTLRQTIEESLQPSQVHIFILDTLNEQYKAYPNASGQPTSDLSFPISATLVNYLSHQDAPVYLSVNQPLPEELLTEKPRLTLLGGQIYIPLPGRTRLAGWVVLGPRPSGEAYTSRDLRFLDTLCEESALAIERAQIVVNLEMRVRQMNTLARVAQGINITLTLDDILELVYAQTTQIIPADDFSIYLLEPQTSVLIPIFSVINNDRLSERENIPVRRGQVLEEEVVQERRPMITDDYIGECQRHGISNSNSELYAWMGVPLNAGAGTIGVMSLASRSVATSFNNEQFTLAQSIADQAAGAITKARLLEETQRRARQLTTLNEVTRQLTSTLDQDLLLQTILQNAVDLLNCEAGSLLLVDQQTDELVFRVTSGPVASDLINRRMPSGSGMVGKAVKTRQAIVVNDVHASPDWSPNNDQDTGFTTRSILVIPLIVQDNAIGVFEVLNKKDGMPFMREDQELLSAFASQAAVAIENARLYTTTDRALAARVEELSVMQRIDRELNISLDTQRAMRITLEWAMRQSGATAGLAGLISENTIGLMASAGYSDELSAYAETPLPMAGHEWSEPLETGMAKRQALNEADPRGILKGARSQVVLPIRREDHTIGAIILESTNPQPITEDMMNFLLRLCEHASIAIANAQLYNAVQAANVAKSEFVSFVSHELKNPMTSIKGYTELLAVGAVGPVNEAQAGFLTTIRANVERMSTLVSDLNDVTRIEANRMRLDFKAMPLPEVMDEVVRSLRRQLEEKQQRLSLELPAGLPQVWADRSRVIQIITNLVSNAYKYTPTGGQIRVFAEACDNQWDSAGAHHVVHLWVQDNGIGISPEDQKKIFQKFFRSEDPKTREAPGTGLGLNITRSLVELQGGRIWFESEFRQGTTFHITLPVAEQ